MRGRELVGMSGLVLWVVVAPASAQWRQAAALSAFDGETADLFGRCVAVDGGTAVIGALLDDDQGQDSGSAYVFEDGGSGWTLSAKLTAADGAPNDYFGASASIDGDTMAIGAPAHNGHGAVYVYARTGGAWLPEATLEPDDGVPGDSFGYSVCIDNATIIVGARDVADHGVSSGAAYVFELSGGVWSQVAKLTAPDGARDDRFGTAVGVSGTAAIVGAFFDDDNGLNSGSVYLFDRVGGAWMQSAKVTPSDGAPVDQFGVSVAIDGDRAVVGSQYDDDRGQDSGSVYVFERIGDAWTEHTKLRASDGAAGDDFGWAVSIDGGTVAVGADRSDALGADSGAAYVFHEGDGAWKESAKLTGDNGAPGDGFGTSVAVRGGVVVVGAEWHDGAAEDSGQAYVFEPCRVDLTGDGVVDTLDFLLFLGAWSQSNPLADWDGNGVVDTLDFLAYLNEWVAGC